MHHVPGWPTLTAISVLYCRAVRPLASHSFLFFWARARGTHGLCPTHSLYVVPPPRLRRFSCRQGLGKF